MLAFYSFEKMVSGMYLGELVRIILVHLVKHQLLFHGNLPKELTVPGGFQTKYITETERYAFLHNPLLPLVKVNHFG